MPDYRVGLTKAADKDLFAIPEPHYGRIFEAVSDLSRYPKPDGSLKLSGFSKLYRIRVGKYRIAYEIDEQNKLVTVTCIDIRDNIYNKVKRRYGL